MKVQTLLISGKQGSGKTTTGYAIQDIFLKQYGWSVEMISFAEVIYRMHDSCLKILSEYGIKRDIVKDGPLLQLLGSDWGRKTINEDVWVNCAKEKIKQLIKIQEKENSFVSKLFIITDSRFPNEFDDYENALRVRLECAKEIRQKRCETWRDKDDHISETALDEYAEQGRFDLKLDTGITNLSDVSNCIAFALHGNYWLK